jgi:hypothetical protein
VFKYKFTSLVKIVSKFAALAADLLDSLIRKHFPINRLLILLMYFFSILKPLIKPCFFL